MDRPRDGARDDDLAAQRHAFLRFEIVIPGPDPGIYLDCRVKPGNDEEKSAEER
jgi:hypothetical protein